MAVGLSFPPFPVWNANSGGSQSLQQLESALEQRLDWATAFKFKGSDVAGVPWKSIKVQNMWWECLVLARKYIAGLKTLQKLFADQIMIRWPPLVKNPDGFVKTVFKGLDELKMAHHDHFYIPLLKSWQEGPWSSIDARIFTPWIDKAGPLYQAWCSRFPFAFHKMQTEIEENPDFAEFVRSLRDHPACNRLGWDSFLKSPITE